MATAAEQAVHKTLDAIHAEIKELEGQLEGYRDTDAVVVHWGHVGSLARILEQLRIANGKED